MPKKTTKRISKTNKVKTSKSRSSSQKVESNHPTKKAHRTKNGALDVRRINAQNRIRATITGTRNLDEAVHKVNSWLKELMSDMNWDNRERALSAFRAALHALRDVLPLHETVHFSAQLPLIFKGIYYDGWVPKDIPSREVNTASEFYDLVREKLGAGAAKMGNNTIKCFTHSILKSLTLHMGENELRKIKSVLRENVRDIIPVSLDAMTEKNINFA